MARAIRITAGSVSAEARLNDSKTAGAIWDALPIDAKGQTWGDEIYFGLPFSAPSDAPQETVALGDLGYWPPGKAFCIFFGPTPASRGIYRTDGAPSAADRTMVAGSEPALAGRISSPRLMGVGPKKMQNALPGGQ